MVQHLAVIHYHLRPGGVRRVIEIALPAIARELNLQSVTLVTGEAAPEPWFQSLVASLPGVNLQQWVDPAFRYTSEQKRRPQASDSVARLLAHVDAVWLHNPSLARNVPLVEAISVETLRRGVPAIYHHHDLWVDNRWLRWPELQTLGYRTLDAVARAVFPGHVFHATINRLDHDTIRKHSKHRVGWLPNPATQSKGPAATEVRRARAWLRNRLGDDDPVWIFPTRFLRRKNLAEAVLLARWLRPDAWLVTTAAVSSPEEAAYARKLRAAAKSNKWRARFAILADAENDAPDVAALIAASEAVVLTSVQEGFGLPFIEAVAAERPLIARSLPNVMPDLRKLGFRFPHAYDEVWIDRDMIDIRAESTRQRTIWKTWRHSLPSSVRPFAGRPPILDADGPIAFSRLTLDAQLEVLDAPPERSWERCAPWNPALRKIHGRPGSLELTPWPAQAGEMLDVAHYAGAFRQALSKAAGKPKDGAEAIQRAFIEQRLGRDFVFPILIE